MSDNNSGNQRSRTAFVVLVSAILLAGVTTGALATLYFGREGNVWAAQNTQESSSLDAAASAVKEITLVAQDADLEISPGKTVRTWTFNGTVPSPTLRFNEGDNVRIKFINETPIPHTIHFHGNHDDINDGVHPQIMPNETYIYNITAGPAGALMYHCHAYPTSDHIRMGMYGAMIVEPAERLEPAREFVLVMGEYDSTDITKFEAEYYPINGYADQYMRNPLEAKHGELVRFYVINLGTTIPSHFHLHSTVFKAYPSGLLSNAPIDAQTIAVGPGDASIVEAKWKYPGTYLFHSHGLQEERGNMGQINIVEDGQSGTLAGMPSTLDTGESISMFDWQYELQKELQKPKIITYDEEELTRSAGANIPTHHHPASEPDAVVKVVSGAASPNNGIFYEPSSVSVQRGGVVEWVNEDPVPHTSTSGDPSGGGPDGLFDTGIFGQGAKAQVTIDAEPGTYDYYCILHPYMKGQIVVEDAAAK